MFPKDFTQHTYHTMALTWVTGQSTLLRCRHLLSRLQRPEAVAFLAPRRSFQPSSCSPFSESYSSCCSLPSMLERNPCLPKYNRKGILMNLKDHASVTSNQSTSSSLRARLGTTRGILFRQTLETE